MEMLLITPVSFTIEAVNEIKRLMTEPDFNRETKLRVGVKGGGCSGMTYILGFDTLKDEDVEFQINEIQCIMNKSHEMYLYGMQIDWQDGLNSRGFMFNNPNASATCGCGTSFAV